MRIIRLIRLIRIVKLYKHAHSAISGDKKEDEHVADPKAPVSPSKGGSDKVPNLNEENIPEPKKPEAEEEVNVPEESKVGKKLSDLTTRRVIMLVLAMMFSVPAFTITTYKEENNSFTFGLELIREFGNDVTSAGFNTTFDSYISEHLDIRTPLILVNAKDRTWEKDNITPNDLRSSEKDIVAIENGDYVSVFDLRNNTRLTAGLGICRTIFVCFVLAAGALFFSKDANDLVISPIEAMIQKVNRIARNPLEAAQEEENEALAMEKAKAEEEKGKSKKEKKEGPYETVILEQTIIKIGALLALGFGEAGAKIIADNMANTGDVDPMIPGNKVVAIFGFCDIRQFTDTTEIL